MKGINIIVKQYKKVGKDRKCTKIARQKMTNQGLVFYLILLSFLTGGVGGFEALGRKAIWAYDGEGGGSAAGP